MYIFNSVIKKGFVIFRQSLLVFILDGILQIHIHMYVALAHSLLALSPKKKNVQSLFRAFKTRSAIHSFIHSSLHSLKPKHNIPNAYMFSFVLSKYM